MRSLILLAFLTGGCGSVSDLDDGSNDAGDSGTDAGFDSAGDPSCHYDCGGAAWCVGGVVRRSGREPIPCWEWTGACPSFDEHTCEEGCRTDLTYVVYGDDPAGLCEESRPRGEPCESHDDCIPRPARVDEDGNVINTYLRCAGGTCVDDDPPVVAGWLDDCYADLSALDPDAWGVVSETTCAAGVCLVAHDTACAGGFAQGCTITCTGDHECPPGSVCEMLTDLTTGATPRVCKPGPPGMLGIGLTCP